MNGRAFLVLFFMLLLLVVCVACSSSDDDGNPSVDDDQADDDEVDDDTSSEYQLEVEPFYNDGHLYGIVCGDDVLLLEDEWAATPYHHAYTCQALDRNTFFLMYVKDKSQGVAMLADGEWHDLGFPTGAKDSSAAAFRFFNRDVGYVAEFEYNSGDWEETGIR